MYICLESLIMEKSRKEIIKEKLTFKYRFVVLNEDTFEERFSFKLNRLNAFIFGGIFSVLLIILTILFITLTPLKEYIQGYSSSELQKETTDLVYKVDSLNQALSVNDLYIENIQQVLKGEIKRDSASTSRGSRHQLVSNTRTTTGWRVGTARVRFNPGGRICGLSDNSSSTRLGRAQ